MDTLKYLDIDMEMEETDAKKNKYQVINNSHITYYTASSCYDVYRYCLVCFADFEILLEKILEEEDDDENFSKSDFGFLSYKEYENLLNNYQTVNLKDALKNLPNSAIKILFNECFDSEGLINYGKPHHEKDNLIVQIYKLPIFKAI
jgi:hypothetical protein